MRLTYLVCASFMNRFENRLNFIYNYHQLMIKAICLKEEQNKIYEQKFLTISLYTGLPPPRETRGNFDVFREYSGKFLLLKSCKEHHVICFLSTLLNQYGDRKH